MGNSMRIGSTADGGQAYKTSTSTGAGMAESNQKDQIKNGALFAGNLNLVENDIAKKREEAQKEALGLIRSQFGSDKEIDEGMEEKRARVSELREDNMSNLKEIQSINQEMDKLKEEYGVADDSQEQKDLELLIKQKNAMKPGSRVSLSEEESKRLAEMGPMTEYQESAMNLENAKEPWEKQIRENNDEIKANLGAVNATKQALLQNKGMVDADNAADAILKAASDEIMGMIIQDVQDKIDEDLEKIEEEADKKAEEKEEKEALEEAAKEKREENNASSSLNDTVEMAGNSKIDMDKVKQGIDEILRKQKLLEEDIKGIEVNAKV